LLLDVFLAPDLVATQHHCLPALLPDVMTTAASAQVWLLPQTAAPAAATVVVVVVVVVAKTGFLHCPLSLHVLLVVQTSQSTQSVPSVREPWTRALLVMPHQPAAGVPPPSSLVQSL